MDCCEHRALIERPLNRNRENQSAYPNLLLESAPCGHLAKQKTTKALCLTSLALQEIVTAGSSMSNHSLEIAVCIKDDSIWARTSARVYLVGAQDRKLLIRLRVREAEAFVVVVRVRVFIATDRLALPVVAAALVHGSINVRLPVAG